MENTEKTAWNAEKKKNSFITSGTMNLQHSQWNHLLGFGGLARKVAISDATVD